jgi:DNA-directed RNA polymerase subunit RPC12/RpoP
MLTLECQSCGAALELEPSQRTAKCLYCGSPSVVERPPTPDRPPPSFALGFVVTPERALETARTFVKKPLFAPEAFRNAAIEEIRGIYLPAYLYSAAVYTGYRAQIGENYTVTETYRDAQGKRRTRRKTKTEWRPLSGQHATYVSDLVVTASRGIPNVELEAIEPFDMRALHRYTPKVISGWASEEPSLARDACLTMARGEALQAVGRQLGPFMPGDRHQGLQWQSRMDEEDLSLVLVPIWVLPIRYSETEPFVRLLVNGQTGRIAGTPPFSWTKVLWLVLFVLGVLGLCLGSAFVAKLFAEAM